MKLNKKQIAALVGAGVTAALIIRVGLEDAIKASA